MDGKRGPLFFFSERHKLKLSENNMARKMFLSKNHEVGEQLRMRGNEELSGSHRTEELSGLRRSDELSGLRRSEELIGVHRQRNLVVCTGQKSLVVYTCQRNLVVYTDPLVKTYKVTSCKRNRNKLNYSHRLGLWLGWKVKNAYRILMGKPLRKRPL
jgi:hypothetical protein